MNRYFEVDFTEPIRYCSLVTPSDGLRKFKGFGFSIVWDSHCRCCDSELVGEENEGMFGKKLEDTRDYIVGIGIGSGPFLVQLVLFFLFSAGQPPHMATRPR